MSVGQPHAGDKVPEESSFEALPGLLAVLCRHGLHQQRFRYLFSIIIDINSLSLIVQINGRLIGTEVFVKCLSSHPLSSLKSISGF